MALSENYIIQNNTLKDIADAIREKTGSSEKLSPSDMATEIGKITVGSSTFTLKYVILNITGKVTDSAQGEWYYYTAPINDYVNGNNYMLVFDFKGKDYGEYSRCAYSPALTNDNDIYYFSKSYGGIQVISSGWTSNNGFFGGSYTGMRGEIHDNRIFIRKDTSSLIVANKGLLIYAGAA